MQENDFKALVKKVIRLLDRDYWNYGNHTNTEQAIKETEFMDSIQSILEYANKRILTNFQYRLLMEYEDEGTMTVDRRRRTCGKIVEEIIDAHETNDYPTSNVLLSISKYIISTYLYTGIFVCILNEIRLQAEKVGAPKSAVIVKIAPLEVES